MPAVFAADCIVAVHDCGDDAAGAKGRAIVALLREGFCASRPGAWHMPAAAPVAMPDGCRINACTAFFLPQCLTP